jgi:hypothetical protein
MTTTAPTQRRRYLPPSTAQQQQEQQLRPTRRRGPNRYPGGHDISSRAQRRECIFFCVLITILSLILFHLISLLLYINASSYSFLFGGSASIDFHDDQPILVIGGTDGSGTRAFVDTLNRLGVVIVSDDLQTFDVHATELFQKQGWPKFVTTVLKETHSADYRWTDLAADTQRILRLELAKLKTSLGQKYKKEKSKRKRLIQQQRRSTIFSAGGGARQAYNSSAVASKVSYAIKAPVSMMVLPVLQQFFDRPIKFLHVVRE